MKKLIYFLIFISSAFGLLLVYSFSKKDSTYLVRQVVQKSTETKSDTKYVSPLSVEYLRNLKINESNLQIEKELSNGTNYKKYIASFKSEGYKIYGLLTVPKSEMPEGGFSAIIFNHGYIPPKGYKTEEKYVEYVDYLAKNNFVVFKIDLRGHGNSEGVPSGSYFSNAYTVDVLSAIKALKTDNRVNSQKIGLWGHSMAGNLVLRSMLVTSEIKASVIWAGAVYSYKDFAKYGIADNSYVRRENINDNVVDSNDEKTRSEIVAFRENREAVNFDTDFWKSISLTENLKYLESPIQIHHSVNDATVNVGYSKDLKMELDKSKKISEYFEYKNGGHNIDGVYFTQAMQKTVEFFKRYL
ncbi:alpha/beta hydrolase [Patescibacteria group bacterium]|nr:alpha/beta hydrolase [Patescibacteria group bacterium]